MGTKRSTSVVFKEYTPNQLLLIPPTWEEMIAESHPVMASAIIDRIVYQAVIVKVVGKSYRIKNLTEVQDLYKNEEVNQVKRGRPRKSEVKPPLSFHKKALKTTDLLYF